MFFFCLMAINAIAQDVYAFDYYTVYEYSKKKNSKSKSRELTYSDSKNPNVHFIVLEDDGKVFFNYLVDNSKKLSYVFAPLPSLMNNEKKELKFEKTVPFNIRSDKKNVYDIVRKADTTRIIRYKDQRKKKIVNECVVATVPTEITPFQRYNFFPFRNPLFLGRFAYDNPELITFCYFVENGKKVHFRNLKEIKQTNFTVTVPKQENAKK